MTNLEFLKEINNKEILNETILLTWFDEQNQHFCVYCKNNTTHEYSLNKKHDWLLFVNKLTEFGLDDFLDQILPDVINDSQKEFLKNTCVGA